MGLDEVEEEVLEVEEVGFELALEVEVVDGRLVADFVRSLI